MFRAPAARAAPFLLRAGPPRTALVARWLSTTRAAALQQGGTAFPVYFASQTGTAKSFAKQIAKGSKKRKDLGSVKGVVTSLADAKLAALTEGEGPHLAVFVTSTYGQGEPPDNAKAFFTELQAAPDESLQDLRVLHFGLGCKATYPDRYQAFSRALEAELRRAGATFVLPRGEGDDSGSLEQDFEKWQAELWPALGGVLAGGDGQTSGAATAAATGPGADADASHEDETPRVHLRDADSIIQMPSSCMSTGEVHPAMAGLQPVEEDSEGVISARVMANVELFGPESARSCRHLVLRCPGATYTAGDHLGVLPSNSPTSVIAFASAVLGPTWSLQLDQRLAVEAAYDNEVLHALPGGCTLREALLHLFDVGGPVSRGAVEALASLAGSPTEAQALRGLAGQDTFAERVTRARLALADVVCAFPSVRANLTLGHALDLLRPLAPRYYSISSSPLAHGADEVHLTVGVVRETKQTLEAQGVAAGQAACGSAAQQLVRPQGAVFHGCCSTFCASLSAHSPHSIVPVIVRPSTFRLPADPASPLLMVAAGTGIAPLRGFLHELAARRAGGGTLPRSTSFYFGCCHEAFEFPHSDEVKGWAADGLLTHFRPAYSHDGPSMVFAQHRIAEDADRVWQLLHREGAYVYVCGDGKTLGNGVREALLGIVASKLGTDVYGAKQYMEEVREQGRFQEDVF